jgi:hypothetical protein
MRMLDPLEEDFLGDLARDDHSLYEIFGFVRLHHPDVDEARVFAVGRALVQDWVARGWLELSDDQKTWGEAKSVDDLLSILDRHGIDATRYFEGSPELRLGENAYAEIDGLRRP